MQIPETCAIEPEEVAPAPPRQTPGKIFLRFLRFGLLAWGGPVAQIAMIRHELVEQEKWITSERFNRTLAVYQALPGPEAQELCVYFGVVAGGRWGGFLAGLGFLLPGLLLMLIASWLYVRFGLASLVVAAIFYGCQPAAVALVARAVHRIAGHALHADRALWAIAALSAVAAWFSVPFLLTLLLSGLAYTTAKRQNPLAAGKVLWILPLLYLPTLLFPTTSVPTDVTTAAATTTVLVPPSPLLLFGTGLRSGLLSFGGAYTALSFLQNDAVVAGRWMTQPQFLDGLAITGILPAPLVIFGTFVGYLGGGFWGAILVTTGIFLPAFGFSLLGHAHVERLIENKATHALLDGITAGVVGLIVVTAIQLFRATVTDWPTLTIFALALLATYKWKAKFAIVGIMLGAALISLLLHR